MTADLPSLLLSLVMLAIPAAALTASILDRRKPERRIAPFGRVDF